jgi:hypothetical protein
MPLKMEDTHSIVEALILPHDVVGDYVPMGVKLTLVIHMSGEVRQIF